MPSQVKNVASSRSSSPVQPPAAERENGSRTRKMPTVMNTNCIMSVSVIDHIPPSTEYATTTTPPSRIAHDRSSGKRTEKIAAYAEVEVTESITV